MKTHFEGERSLIKIIMDLDKWNRKYNQENDKYLSLASVNGDWHCDNCGIGKVGEIDFFINKNEIKEKMKNKKNITSYKMCNFCDYGNTGSRYGVFNMNYCGEGKVSIDSEHNDDDEWDINYCPLCGKKLKE